MAYFTTSRWVLEPSVVVSVTRYVPAGRSCSGIMRLGVVIGMDSDLRPAASKRVSVALDE